MSTLDRIIHLCEKCNKTQKDLTDYLGLEKSTFSSWKNGKSASYKKHINKIADFFNVSTDYLLTDKDSMISKNPTIPTEYQSLINSYQELSKDNQQLLQDIISSMIDIQNANEKHSEIEYTTREIELMINKASAGKGYDLDSPDSETIQIIQTPEAEEADIAITIEGESMSPDFHDGDIVLIKYQESIEIGQVGIFRINNGKGYIKERGKDFLISRNPEFDNIVPGENDQVDCIGLVLGIAERVE